nr:MAG TPA: hypothetical protein [Caudoviricetes sp.]
MQVVIQLVTIPSRQGNYNTDLGACIGVFFILFFRRLL